MLRTAFRLLIRVGLVVGLAASFGTGCSRQAEGERCDFTWAGDQDCDDGLVCTPCGNLQKQQQIQEQNVDRCCKPGGSYTDTRCIPTTNPTGEACNTHIASTGGTGGTNGEAGTGATSDVGGTGGGGGTTTEVGGTGGSGATGGEAGTGAASGSGGVSETPDGG